MEMKPIPGFPGYCVTDDGRIWSEGSGLFLKTDNDPKHGYPRVGLYRNRKHVNLRVHVAVLLAFRGPKQPGQVSRHLDDNKLNNHISNLVWGTPRENVQDAIKHNKFPVLTPLLGEMLPQSKLTNQKVRAIRILHKQGLNQAGLARMFEVSENAIHLVLTQKTWKHVI